MSTIYFDPREIKGLAEVLIDAGHDRERIYDLIQVAHVVNALAYEARYNETVETYDLRDADIYADKKSFLAETGGIGHLIYNLDDQMPLWLEDRLYELRTYAAPGFYELRPDYGQRYTEYAAQAIEANQPSVAYWFSRRAAACAFHESPQLQNVIPWPNVAAKPKPSRKARKTSTASTRRTKADNTKVTVKCVQRAWVRNPDAPVGSPASGRIRCPCGQAPESEYNNEQPPITCKCGTVYAWNGYILSESELTQQ